MTSVNKKLTKALDDVRNSFDNMYNYAHDRHAPKAQIGVACRRFERGMQVLEAELEKHETFTCDICGGTRPVSEKHVAMALDGADTDQPMDLVQVCGPCYENEVDAPGWGYSNDYSDPDDYELTGKEYPKWRVKAGHHPPGGK